MSGQPAARVGDTISCPLPQSPPAPLPHAPPPGLPIVPPGAPTVLIGGQPAARMDDFELCVTPAPTPNKIAKGAFPVPILKKAAARITDPGTHPGSLIVGPGCPTVLIGLAGTTGNRRLGNAACQAAAGGRASGSRSQSYNNCGIESSRQIANQARGGRLNEDGLLTWAKNNPSLNVPLSGGRHLIGPPGSANLVAHGGTFPSTQAGILAQHGVSAGVASSANKLVIQEAMMNGKGVIANLDAGFLWPITAPHVANPGPRSYHAVTVVGIEYDDAGEIKKYYINDTGTGQCDQEVSRDVFENATGKYQKYGNGLVVTDNPIW